MMIAFEHDAAFGDIEAPHPHIGSTIAGFENGHQAIGLRSQGRQMQRNDVLGDRRQSGLVHAGQRLARRYSGMVGFGLKRVTRCQQLAADKMRTSRIAAISS